MDSEADVGVGAPHDTATVDAGWVLAQLQQQQEVNALLSQALEGLQRQLETPGASQSQASTASETGLVRKAKHSLSHPDKYDGRDKASYSAFRGHLRAKLRIDQAAIGGKAEQVWYGFGRLADEASKRIFPWIETIERRGKPLQVNAFFEQLDAAFYDVQIPQRALEWINTKKQGTEPFRDFLQKFEQKLLKTGGWDFSEEIRKGYLKAALNLDLRIQLIARDEPKTYIGFVELVRKASDDLDQIKRIKRQRSRWNTVRLSQETADATGSMDWESTPRAASGKSPNHDCGDKLRKAAKWVSQETLDQRRSDQQCLRCRGDDHFVSQCRYGPAKRPTQSRPERKVKAVVPKEETPSEPAKTKRQKAITPHVEEVLEDSE